MDLTDFTDVPLLSDMTDDELANVAAHFTEVHVRSGDALTHEDEYGATFYIVLDGQVRVKIHDEAVVDLGPGDHFGEVALVTGERRNATVPAAALLDRTQDLHGPLTFGGHRERERGRDGDQESG